MTDRANGLMVVRSSAGNERFGRTIVLGLIVEGGIVTEVAPYGKKWGVVGQDAREVWRGLARRGWRLYWLADPGDAAGPTVGTVGPAVRGQLQPGDEPADRGDEADTAADHDTGQEDEDHGSTSR